MLLQLFHLFQSQKNESLNFHQIQLTPKDQHFSLTMELSDHNVLLVLIDSVGYQSAIKKIIMALGFNINNVASEYLQ